MLSARSETVAIAEAYYDSSEADEFYKNFWGGEDIHIGLYENSGEEVAAASRRTVVTMAMALGALSSDSKVLDLGSGYGGSARYLAGEFGCVVDCLNLSQTQNRLNSEKNRTTGLDRLINVIHGSFEDIPAEAAAYDVVWSQDAFLHSGHRKKVLDEIDRVCKAEGQLIFTDPMQADDCPEGVLQPILDRIHLESMGSFAFYARELEVRGFEKVSVRPMLSQLKTHYSRIGEEVRNRYELALSLSGKEYVDNMLRGLEHWVFGADENYLSWGIMHYRKMN
jgi:ubiquinone/menaquinone biosynthesis C-methylase UbiE